ncbi:MAG TPA: PstA family ABC transporter permease, partial [Phycisphaerales bacterium]|nr:PstA family ABC transporter permease [Phycisphaerales bacterium]
KHLDAGFLTSFPSRKPAEAGIKAALWGTVWLCAVCLCVAVPIGVLTAVFLEEYRPRHRLAKRAHAFVSVNITNLAGVPSIVYGILGLTVFVRMFGLFGNPNISAYDEMVRASLRSGEVVIGMLVDETDEALTIASPVRGEVTLAKDQVARRRTVYVREHRFRLDDGTLMTGELRGSEKGLITLAAAGDSEHVFPATRVAQHTTKNVLQLGDPESFFYVRLPLGGSVLAGGLTLSLVILPIVIIAAREALRAVPPSLREGALALGATRWQTIWRTVLPASIPGIMTGSILAVSRAIGEAAPLLVIGGFLFILFTPKNLMDDFAAMPLQIFNWASRPQTEFHEVAAAGILVLLAVLLVFNGLAIVLRHRYSRPLQ